jgi:hypothetical protein
MPFVAFHSDTSSDSVIFTSDTCLTCIGHLLDHSNDECPCDYSTNPSFHHYLGIDSRYPLALAFNVSFHHYLESALAAATPPLVSPLALRRRPQLRILASSSDSDYESALASMANLSTPAALTDDSTIGQARDPNRPRASLR